MLNDIKGKRVLKRNYSDPMSIINFFSHIATNWSQLQSTA